MSMERCQEMILFHKSHRHLTGVGDGSDYTGIRFMHIHTPHIREWIAEVIVNLTGRELQENTEVIIQIEFPDGTIEKGICKISGFVFIITNVK